MSSNKDRSVIQAAVGRQTVRLISKLVLTAVSVIGLLYLVSLLPGLDRLVPATPVSFAALVSAVATLAVVGLLVYLASGLAALTRVLLSGPEEIVENVASVVHWGVVLTAVLVAHWGLAPAVTPVLDGAVWTYDMVFLLLAIPPLAIVAARLYVTLDPAADLFADKIAGPSTREVNGPDDQT